MNDRFDMDTLSPNAINLSDAVIGLKCGTIQVDIAAMQGQVKVDGN